MKIFVSWSGETSHEIARELKEWLPLVHQKLEPFMSSEDIEKGARWASTIGSELEGTNFGILCLTQENVDAPWVCFEAGALAKVVDHSRVAPILFGIQPSDVQGPLAQFQATKFDRSDVGRLVRTINASAPDESRDEGQLEKLIDLLWPDLQSKIEPILIASTKVKPKKVAGGVDKSGPILEELLVLVRQQSQVILDPTQIVPPSYIRDIMDDMFLRRDRDRDRIDPAAFTDLDRYWERFNDEWRAAISGLPKDRFEGLFPLHRRLAEVIDYIVGRSKSVKHRRYPRGPRVTDVRVVSGNVTAQPAQSSGTVETQPSGPIDGFGKNLDS